MKIKYLMPKYMQTFKCIGSLCEDTCCRADWIIGLDEKTAKEYLYHPKEKIRATAKKYVKINPDKRLNSHYAYIDGSCSKDKMCGFCEDGWCQIHSELGESALSTTCYIYPRKINVINTAKEMSGSLSCIEVARQVLKEDASIDFIECELDILPQKEHITNLVTTSSIFNTENHEELFWKMRVLVIGLLSDRRYSIEERLILLGLLHQRLETDLKEENYKEVELALEKFEEDLYKQERINLGELATSSQLKGALLKVIIENKGLLNIQAYVELMDKVQQGFEQYDEDYSISYKMASEEYEHYKESIQVIFERYLIHYVFHTVYPINMSTATNEFSNFIGSYNLLIIHFSIIKMIFMGVYKYNNDNLSEEEMVRIIQIISKLYTQDIGYLGSIVELFKELGVYSVAWMVILLNS